MSKRKPKQTEQLPFEEALKREFDWVISEKTKRQGRHWFPIWRKRLQEAGKPEHTPQQ